MRERERSYTLRMQGWAYQDITGPGHVGARAAFHGALFSRLGNSTGEYYKSGPATVGLKAIVTLVNILILFR